MVYHFFTIWFCNVFVKIVKEKTNAHESYSLAYKYIPQYVSPLNTFHFCLLVSSVLHHQWTTNIILLFKSDIQPSRPLVPFCGIVHIQKAMFFSSFSQFKLHFPKSFFGDELALTEALQSDLIFYNTLENERVNDMEINHILLLDQKHSLSLSCSLPWVNYSLHTAIDLSSKRKFGEYLCKDCNWQDVSFNRKMPTFPHKLIINSIVDPTATGTEKG